MSRMKSFILFCIVVGIIVARMKDPDENPALGKSSSNTYSVEYNNYA